MIELVILAAAVSWIARAARTRSASPWVFGAIAIIGYVLVPIALGLIAQLLIFKNTSAPSLATIAGEFIVFASRWMWLGGVALFVSRVPGRTRVQPTGRWSCRACGYLNDSTSLKCDACGEPYREPPAVAAAGDIA